MLQHLLILPSQSLVDMAPKYILEQFLQQELLINITEHEVSSAGRPFHPCPVLGGAAGASFLTTNCSSCSCGEGGCFLSLSYLVISPLLLTAGPRARCHDKRRSNRAAGQIVSFVWSFPSCQGVMSACLGPKMSTSDCWSV